MRWERKKVDRRGRFKVVVQDRQVPYRQPPWPDVWRLQDSSRDLDAQKGSESAKPSRTRAGGVASCRSYATREPNPRKNFLTGDFSSNSASRPRFWNSLDQVKRS